MNLQNLNTDQMQELERHAFENYPITLDQMMQNAGKAVFDVIVDEIIPTESQNHNPDLWRILVVTGKGNNGGDALVTAQLLKKEGLGVVIYCPYPDKDFTEAARRELEKCRGVNIPINRRRDWPISPAGLKYSLMIDALFGFSLKGNPRPPADEIIEQINCSQIPVLSVDVPSGLDVSTGKIGSPTVKADYTIALGMPKIGLKEHSDYVGRLYLGDLGISAEAYRDKGYKAPDFEGKSYMKMTNYELRMTN